MPATLSVTERPPAPLRRELSAERRKLRSLLDDAVPAKSAGENLLIATWNIRALGGLTRRWNALDSDSPKRDLRALRLIADVVSRFDLVAVQEARAELTAMLELLEALGGNWGVIFTDVTRGNAGNSERLAYVFDRDRVRPSGLAAELVVPSDRTRRRISLEAFDDGRQFVRTPYAVSFEAGAASFILVTLHVLFGKKAKDRVPELESIAQWLRDWADWEHAYDDEIIALGDFNIDRLGKELYAAFTSTGLQTPPDLDFLPRTIFGGAPDRFYDQIAWFNGAGGAPALESLQYLGGGIADFAGAVFPELSRKAMSWRVSDHYPLWAEFRIVPPGSRDGG